MNDEILRDKLNKIIEQIKQSPHHWRFNYSVGLIDGSCYGASVEDDKKRLIQKSKERSSKDEQ